MSQDVAQTLDVAIDTGVFDARVTVEQYQIDSRLGSLSPEQIRNVLYQLSYVEVFQFT